MQVKLEVIGENMCARWHRDNYVARAITSYTGVTGTMWTPDWNIDEDNLVNGAENSDIIRDKREVHALGVGDICFMKGLGYPKGPKGLVHKAADRAYHPDGGIVYRLALKVDIPHPTRAQVAMPSFSSAVNNMAAMFATLPTAPVASQGHGEAHGHGHGHAHDGQPCSSGCCD